MYKKLDKPVRLLTRNFYSVRTYSDNTWEYTSCEVGWRGVMWDVATCCRRCCVSAAGLRSAAETAAAATAVSVTLAAVTVGGARGSVPDCWCLPRPLSPLQHQTITSYHQILTDREPANGATTASVVLSALIVLYFPQKYNLFSIAICLGKI